MIPLQPSLRSWVFALASGLVCGLVLLASPEPTTAGAAEAPRLVNVGAEAPAMALVDLSGAAIGLESVRGQKDLIAVFFRGAW